MVKFKVRNQVNMKVKNKVKNQVTTLVKIGDQLNTKVKTGSQVSIKVKVKDWGWRSTESRSGVRLGILCQESDQC